VVGAVGLEDVDRSVGQHLDGPATFVDPMMVAGAERNQVVEIGRPAVFPFVDVV
jgi:hypothetical protein